MGECIITRRGREEEITKLPILNSKYPKDITANNGDQVTFSVDFAEHGKPTIYTYQWYIGGILIDGATNSTYVRNTSSDKGNYIIYCKVTNKAGSVKSRTATLKANTLKINKTIELEGYFYEGSHKEEVSSVGPYNLTKYSTVKADVKYTTSGVCVFVSKTKRL